MTEALRPMHVIDRNGFIWRVMRDGGMATRADWAGVTSIGIEELRETRGPIEEVEPLIDGARELGAAYVELQERFIRFADDVGQKASDLVPSTPTGRAVLEEWEGEGGPDPEMARAILRIEREAREAIHPALWRRLLGDNGVLRPGDASEATREDVNIAIEEVIFDTIEVQPLYARLQPGDGD